MPSRAEKALTRKVGPLPVWGWAAALVGVLIVYRYYRGVAQTSAGTVSAVPSTSPSPSQVDTAGSATGGSGMGSPADNLSAGLLEALGQQGFGTKDSYNTFAPAYTYTYSPTTTTDYGSGNTFPPSGGTAPGANTLPGELAPVPGIAPAPASGPYVPHVPPGLYEAGGASGSATAVVASAIPFTGPFTNYKPGTVGGFTATNPGGLLLGHGAVIE